MTELNERLERIQSWSDDILEFASDALKLDLRPTQRAMLEGASDLSTKSMTTCFEPGTGGTTALAVLALWEALREQDRRTVIVTAPTMAQLKNVFLPVASELVSRSKLLSEIFDTGMRGLFLSGCGRFGGIRVLSARPENFQGGYGPVTVLVDQASGVEFETKDAIRNTCSYMAARGPFQTSRPAP